MHRRPEILSTKGLCGLNKVLAVVWRIKYFWGLRHYTGLNVSGAIWPSMDTGLNASLSLASTHVTQRF